MVDRNAILGLNSSAGRPNATEVLPCHSDHHLMLAAPARQLCSCCYNMGLASCVEGGVQGLDKACGCSMERVKEG